MAKYDNFYFYRFWGTHVRRSLDGISSWWLKRRGSTHSYAFGDFVDTVTYLGESHKISLVVNRPNAPKFKLLSKLQHRSNHTDNNVLYVGASKRVQQIQDSEHPPSWKSEYHSFTTVLPTIMKSGMTTYINYPKTTRCWNLEFKKFKMADGHQL